MAPPDDFSRRPRPMVRSTAPSGLRRLRPTDPSGPVRLPGPVLALWEDRSREHTGCARRLPHDSAVFMRPMQGALRNDPPRAPFSAPIGRRGAGRPLAAPKNGNTESHGTCGTRSGRSGAGACPNLLQRRPGPGSTAEESAEYQRFSSGAPARSGPLQQIWTTCRRGPSGEGGRGSDGDHDGRPDDRTRPAGRPPGRRRRRDVHFALKRAVPTVVLESRMHVSAKRAKKRADPAGDSINPGVGEVGRDFKGRGSGRSGRARPRRAPGRRVRRPGTPPAARPPDPPR